jgi:error-prone DNA polymerase
VEGPLQNQDNVIHIKATRLENLAAGELEVRSHDFH